MNIILVLFKLSRPVNVLISFVTIIVAAELAWGLSPLLDVLLAALSAALITVGANVINDYFDIEIDLINKPARPLAAGIISKQMVLMYFIFVYFFSLDFIFLHKFIDVCSRIYNKCSPIFL